MNYKMYSKKSPRVRKRPHSLLSRYAILFKLDLIKTGDDENGLSKMFWEKRGD